MAPGGRLAAAVEAAVSTPEALVVWAVFSSSGKSSKGVPMRYEIIENDVVVNTIMADAEFMSATFAEGSYRAVPEPPAEPDPRLWWMDVGPFYDRFGADAVAIAASDNGACKAVQTLTGVRKYVDLKDPRIGQMIDMLIATAQPAAQPWAPGSGPMTVEKKEAILTTPTTEYERHVKGLIGAGG